MARSSTSKDREIEGRVVRAVDQAYTAGMWFKATLLDNAEAKEWCKSRGIGIGKAQGEGVDSAGGFLVPEELMANIIVLREQFGVFRKECQLVPMGSDTLNWPRRTGGLTAFFTGENQAVSESQAAWDNVNLTAKKLAVLTRMSTEIDQDAVVAIADWLVGEMAYAFASKEDDCGFNGDGTSTYGGMRGSPCWRSTATTTPASSPPRAATTASPRWWKDYTGLMGTCRNTRRQAKWYMSQQGSMPRWRTCWPGRRQPTRRPHRGCPEAAARLPGLDRAEAADHPGADRQGDVLLRRPDRRRR
jgi:HK97 family phage major capsid protein